LRAIARRLAAEFDALTLVDLIADPIVIEYDRIDIALVVGRMRRREFSLPT